MTPPRWMRFMVCTIRLSLNLISLRAGAQEQVTTRRAGPGRPRPRAGRGEGRPGAGAGEGCARYDPLDEPNEHPQNAAAHHARHQRDHLHEPRWWRARPERPAGHERPAGGAAAEAAIGSKRPGAANGKGLEGRLHRALRKGLLQERGHSATVAAA